jgi:hypothetical protein
MFVGKEERSSGEDATFSKVMEKAANLLEKRGKASCTLYDGNMLCTWAAVYEAERGHRVRNGDYGDNPTHRRLDKFIRSISSAGGICGFNNAYSKEIVVAMLHRAAKEA